MYIKKCLVFLLFVVGLFVNVSAVSAQDTGWTITNFHSDVELSSDNSFTVTETIDVDFNTLVKHGIFREIPYKYKTNYGNTQKVNIDLVSVTNGAGAKIPVSESKSGGNIVYKIGDANRTISGKQTYEITYKVERALIFSEEYAELYWNVTGIDWPVPILASSATVRAPDQSVIDTICFTGFAGATTPGCTKTSDGSQVEFASLYGLNPSQGLTFSIKMDADSFTPPTAFETAWYFLSDNWVYLLALIPTLVISIIWFKRGRDVRYVSEGVYYKPEDQSIKTVSLFERKTLPMVYHPIDTLSPSEVGTIKDGRVDMHDVIAEIVEAARLGIIQIEKIKRKGLIGSKTDYAFIKTNKYEKELPNLRDYQRYLMKELFRSTVVHNSVEEADKLFTDDKGRQEKVLKLLGKHEYVLLSALKNHFYKGLPTYKSMLYKRMESEKLFAGNPEHVRRNFIGLFIAMEVLVSFGIGFSAVVNPAPLAFALNAILLVPGFIMAYSMPRRTAWGYSLYKQTEGLKFYMEKGKWRHEIAEKQLFIEEMLPLAIALGVVNQLAKEMKDLDMVPPEYIGGMHASSFSRDFSSFSSSATSSLVSSPQSSSGGSGFSGGSSGGGFGGGGGGSW